MTDRDRRFWILTLISLVDAGIACFGPSDVQLLAALSMCVCTFSAICFWMADTEEKR